MCMFMDRDRATDAGERKVLKMTPKGRATYSLGMGARGSSALIMAA